MLLKSPPEILSTHFESTQNQTLKAHIAYANSLAKAIQK